MAVVAECGQHRMGSPVAVLLCRQCLEFEAWAETASVVVPLAVDAPARDDADVDGEPVASWPPGGRVTRAAGL